MPSGKLITRVSAGAAKCKTKNKKHWLKWGSLAACFAVLVIAGAAILPSLFRENVDTRRELTPDTRAFGCKQADVQLFAGPGDIKP